MNRKLVKIILIPIVCCLLFGCSNYSNKDNSSQLTNHDVECEDNSTTQNNKDVDTDTAVTNEFVTKWLNNINEVESTFCDNRAINEDLPVDDMRAACDALRKDIESESITDEITAFFRLKQIIAMTKMGHTALYYDSDVNPLGNEFAQIDYWYCDGYYRIAILPEKLSEYLGTKLIKIGDYNIDDCLDKVGTVVPYETQSGRINLIYNMNIPMLRYLGIIGSDDTSIKMTVLDGDEEKDFELPIETGEGQTTCDLFNYVDQPKSFQLKMDCYRDDMNYAYEVLEKDHAIYFLYLSCMDSSKESMNSVFDKMMKEFENNPELNHLIIDVRYNQGGYRSVLQGPLMRNKEVLKDKKISLILGRSTASSGCQVYEDCLNYGFDVTSYGQETQGAVHNYTEIRFKQLSADGLTLGFPTVHDNLPRLFEKYGKVKTGLIPDIPVEDQIEDFLNGKDTTLDVILG